ncbi:MAG: response regulator [Bdellovibrionota bacterium]
MDTRIQENQQLDNNHVPFRVLLMERSEESRAAYVHIFEELGADEIDVSKSFASTFQKLAVEKAPYDLIVLDEAFWVDKRIGLRLCRAVRNNENYEHTALIMISDDCNSALIEDAFRSGIDEFLPKYTSLKEFKQLSRSAVEERRNATLAL